MNEARYKGLIMKQYGKEFKDPQAQLAVQALKISSRTSSSMTLFSTHPPLEERVECLKEVVV